MTNDQLLGLLDRLVDSGKSVIVIEIFQHRCLEPLPLALLADGGNLRALVYRWVLRPPMTPSTGGGSPVPLRRRDLAGRNRLR
jgi:hypothetical protein